MVHAMVYIQCKLCCPHQQLGVMADDIIDKSFPYGNSATLAGAKFREVETLDSLSGQVWWTIV